MSIKLQSRNICVDILRDMVEGVIVIDRESVIESINPAAERLLRHLSVFCEGDTLERLGDYYIKVPIGLILENKKQHFSHRLLFRDISNKKIIISMVISPIRRENESNGAVIVLRDITEDDKSQQHFLHMEKLATVEKMVSGIAHEINNPLSGIMGLAQLIQVTPELPGTVRKNIEKILSYTDRSKQIIQGLLLFAEEREMVTTPVNVNQLLDQSIDQHLYRMQSIGIKIIKNFDLNLPDDTVADMYQLKQVFSNIIHNAEYALSEYGGNRVFAVKTERKRNRILISFHNSGYGISKEIINNIFDPFFTTKDVGAGTGLGLSISYGIVRRHKGNIYVKSEGDAKGVTFVVELPVKMAVRDNAIRKRNVRKKIKYGLV